MKIYFAATSDQFIKPIIAVLQANGVECVVDRIFNRKNSIGSDVIWCEWGDENALAVQEFITPAKKILRIHRYEAYNDQFWSMFVPEEFDSIIFVAEHIKWAAEEKAGHELTNAVVIPNMIDIAKYNIAKDKQANNKIAYAGYMCRKKGFGEMIMLANSLPDYEFHVAGTLQENDYQNYLYEDKPDNVFYYPWQEDLNKFYADKTYVLGTSLAESAHMTVMEGMLCGLVPIQRNWKHASKIYPEDKVWSNIQDIKKILKAKPDWEANRQWMLDNFNPDTVMQAIVETINKPKQKKIKQETLTVAIVQSRAKYIDELLHTLSLQQNEVQPFNLKILPNFDKDMSIGQAYNKLADECETDWILYIGDDDIVSADYIDSMFRAYYMRQNNYKKIVGILTGCLIWDDKGSKIAPTTHFPTGCWRSDFIRKHRFDEKLVRQVDTEFISRVNGVAEGVVLQLDWIMGYYYRQHNKNISGNKIKEGAVMHQEPVEEPDVSGK